MKGLLKRIKNLANLCENFINIIFIAQKEINLK